jgi:hypothetical protein
MKVTEADAERVLDMVGQASPADASAVIAQVDAGLPAITVALEEYDHLLSEISAARAAAEGLITRVDSTLHLGEERWEGLKARGATEPAISRALAALRIRSSTNVVCSPP